MTKTLQQEVKEIQEEYFNGKDFEDKSLYSLSKNNWIMLTVHATLSEELIEEFQKSFDDNIWNLVLTYQTLSEAFLIKFVSKFNREHWNTLSYYQKLSDEFVIKYRKKLQWCNLGGRSSIKQETMKYIAMLEAKEILNAVKDIFPSAKINQWDGLHYDVGNEFITIKRYNDNEFYTFIQIENKTNDNYRSVNTQAKTPQESFTKAIEQFKRYHETVRHIEEQVLKSIK